MIRVRLSRRILEHLDGSQAAADLRAGRSGAWPGAESVLRKAWAAPTRSDRSVLVELDFHEREALQLQVENLESAAAQSVDTDPGSSLAELNAARALLRHLRAAAQS